MLKLTLIILLLPFYCLAQNSTITMKEYVDAQMAFERERDELNKQWTQKYMESELTSIRLAVQTANAANEKRLDGINEFRGQLKDQAATFITRGELFAWVIALVGVVFSVMSYNSKKIESMQKFREGSSHDIIKKT